ncbi:MAG: UxaA family hydrolase [Alkalispirochaeta sp.]
MKQDAIMITSRDNVATALRDLEANETCRLVAESKSLSVTVKGPIDYGHKFAVVDIPKGTDIIKYGEVIGRATSDIPQGAHAHIENIESLRGRGDLQQRGA